LKQIWPDPPTFLNTSLLFSHTGGIFCDLWPEYVSRQSTRQTRVDRLQLLASELRSPVANAPRRSESRDTGACTFSNTANKTSTLQPRLPAGWTYVVVTALTTLPRPHWIRRFRHNSSPTSLRAFGDSQWHRPRDCPDLVIRRLNRT